MRKNSESPVLGVTEEKIRFRHFSSKCDVCGEGNNELTLLIDGLRKSSYGSSVHVSVWSGTSPIPERPFPQSKTWKKVKWDFVRTCCIMYCYTKSRVVPTDQGLQLGRSLRRRNV